MLYGSLCQTSYSNTTHTAAVSHRRAGTKPNAFVQSTSEPADLRKQEFGSEQQCCIWLHKKLTLGSLLRPAPLKTHPFWHPQLLILQPLLARIAPVRCVTAVQILTCCFGKKADFVRQQSAAGFSSHFMSLHALVHVSGVMNTCINYRV